MSRINDALKQAKQTSPGNVSNPRPIFRADDHETSPAVTWLVSALVFLLIAAGCFWLGWIISNHNTGNNATDQDTNVSAQAVSDIPLPVINSTVTNPPTEVTNVPVPVLQGIFYSPASPSAIMNDKTVQPGDQIGPYRVKAISKYTVTLVGPDGNEIQVGM
jgi:hypothetical protein